MYCRCCLILLLATTPSVLGSYDDDQGTPAPTPKGDDTNDDADGPPGKGNYGANDDDFYVDDSSCTASNCGDGSSDPSALGYRACVFCVRVRLAHAFVCCVWFCVFVCFVLVSYGCCVMFGVCVLFVLFFLVFGFGVFARCHVFISRHLIVLISSFYFRMRLQAAGFVP